MILPSFCWMLPQCTPAHGSLTLATDGVYAVAEEISNCCGMPAEIRTSSPAALFCEVPLWILLPLASPLGRQRCDILSTRVQTLPLT